MVKRSIAPALFDISQDIVGDIPFDIVTAWTKSKNKDSDSARRILQPTKVKGYVVSSDASGLSKLSQNKDLIEVLALISEPKEIVYALGSEIGGEGIGIWAADNTQMFYPRMLSPHTVLSMLVETQMRLQRCEVSIGMGVHYGEFYKIGNGLYGPEADFIEHLAEEDTGGGEIVITESFLKKMAVKDGFQLQPRQDLSLQESVFRVTTGPGLDSLVGENIRYPIPFSDTFFGDLRLLSSRKYDPAFLQILNEKYVVEKVVVLIEREHILGESMEVTMLNDISLDVIMKKAAFKLLDKYAGDEIKTVGALGIYVFDDPAEAVEFAVEFRQILEKAQVQSRIGIDQGQIIIFEMENNRKDIAGNPVNIASKMAQDYGTLGRMYLTEHVANKVSLPAVEPFEMEVSRVKIQGVVI